MMGNIIRYHALDILQFAAILRIAFALQDASLKVHILASIRRLETLSIGEKNGIRTNRPYATQPAMHNLRKISNNADIFRWSFIIVILHVVA